MMKYGKNTGDLFAELKVEKNVGNYLERNQTEFAVPLNEYIPTIDPTFQSRNDLFQL